MKVSRVSKLKDECAWPSKDGNEVKMRNERGVWEQMFGLEQQVE